MRWQQICIYNKRVDVWIILDGAPVNRMGGRGADWSGSGQRQLAGWCESCDGYLSFIKLGEFIGQQKNYQRFKDSAPPIFIGQQKNYQRFKDSAPPIFIGKQKNYQRFKDSDPPIFIGQQKNYQRCKDSAPPIFIYNKGKPKQGTWSWQLSNLQTFKKTSSDVLLYVVMHS
jgi:hypothetical protein